MTESTPASQAVAISLKDVWVQYQLRHAHHYNLKRTMTNMITGRQEATEVISALRALTLEVPAGSRVGLVGPNGSGKSTLLAVMAQVLRPTHGTVAIRGKVLALLGGPDEGLDPEQTGRENALALGIRLGESPDVMRERLGEIHAFSGLGPRFDHPVYTYSSGMHVRVRFSTITSMQADVLLVDEGLGAADAHFNERANQRLQGFYEASGTLVLASHSTEVVRQHCSTALQLENGIIADFRRIT